MKRLNAGAAIAIAITAIGLSSVGYTVPTAMSAQGEGSILVPAGTAVGPTEGVFSRPARFTGEVFLKSTFTYHHSVDRSAIAVLSGESDGNSPTTVDDVIVIKVTRPNGSVASLTHDYSGGCGPLVPLPPTLITHLFQPGPNKVTVTLKDKCGAGVGADPMWITPGAPGAGGTVPAVPARVPGSIRVPAGTAVSPTAGVFARPASAVGEVFLKSVFTYLHAAGSEAMLSGQPDGYGSTGVDDVVIIKVTRPDQSRATWTHDYSGGCGPLVPLPPTFITHVFQHGENKVTVTLKDKCGGGVGADPMWITPTPTL